MMRKTFGAAWAALLGVFFGGLIELISTSAAAQERPRQSMSVMHVVREGERLSDRNPRSAPVADDGARGIMRYYFGRRSDRDIERLRTVGQNWRSIRRFCREYVSDEAARRRSREEADCLEWRYTIARSVGMRIEIPVRLIPRSRREMIPAVRTLVAQLGTEEPPALAGSEPAGDAEEGEAPPEATAVAVQQPCPRCRECPDPVVCPQPPGNTGGGGGSHGSNHPGGDVGGDGSGGSEGTGTASTAAGAGGWAVSLLLLACLGFVVLRRRAKPEAPFNAETDPRTAELRKQRDEQNRLRQHYFDANGRLENENADLERKVRDLETKTGSAATPAPDPKIAELEDKLGTLAKQRDEEQGAKNRAHDALRKIGEALGITVDLSQPKPIWDPIIDRVRQAAAFVQKICDWTLPAERWDFALAGEAFDLRLQEVADLEEMAGRALKRLHLWGSLAIARKREVDGLNMGFEKHQEETAKAFLQLTKRSYQLETQLREGGIEPAPWPEPEPETPAPEGLPIGVSRSGKQREDVTVIRTLEVEAALETDRKLAEEGEPLGDEDLIEAEAADAQPELLGEHTHPGVGLPGAEQPGHGPVAPGKKRVVPQTEEPGNEPVEPVKRVLQTEAYGLRPPTEDELRAVAQQVPVLAPAALPRLGEDNRGNGSEPARESQPVMCGCGKVAGRDIRWLDWEEHVKTCPEWDGGQVPGASDAPTPDDQPELPKIVHKPRTRRETPT